MTPLHRRILGKAAICALLVTASTKPASANSIPTRSDVVWIGVAVAAIGAGIGITIYAVVHHNHSLTGCAVTGSSGLQLRNEGDQQSYSLVGEIAGIKSGDRVRVSGKKSKGSAGAPRQFLVEKFGKDYGACNAH